HEKDTCCLSHRRNRPHGERDTFGGGANAPSEPWLSETSRTDTNSVAGRDAYADAQRDRHSDTDTNAGRNTTELFARVRDRHGERGIVCHRGQWRRPLCQWPL